MPTEAAFNLQALRIVASVVRGVVAIRVVIASTTAGVVLVHIGASAPACVVLVQIRAAGASNGAGQWQVTHLHVALVIVALAGRSVVVLGAGNAVVVATRALAGQGRVVVDGITFGSRRGDIVVALVAVVDALVGARIVIQNAFGARRGAIVIVFLVIGAVSKNKPLSFESFP